MKLSTKIFIGSLVCFIFTIIFGFICFSNIFKAIINDQKSLKKGSEMRDLYLKIPFPLTFCVYFFNVTNPMEINNKGATPILKEVGPYCYDTYKEKHEVIDNEEEDSLSYNLYETFFYNPEKTAPLSHDDYVTILHPVLISLLNLVNLKSPSVLGIVNKAINPIFMNPESIYLTGKVRDILFDGLVLNCTDSSFQTSAVCSQLKIKIPHLIEREKDIYLLSLLGPKNGTLQKRMKILRGIKNPDDLGRLIEFENQTKLSMWGSDKCDEVGGIDGWIFKSFMKKDESIKIYLPDFCRTMNTTFAEETEMKSLTVWRYHTFFIGGEDPEEKCYCPEPKCLRKGVLDVTKCTEVPIVFSLPHFLGADESYLNEVIGLHPNLENHVVKLHFDPLTGSPIQANKRVQVNFQIQPINNVPLTEDIPNVLHPVIWMDESVELEGKYLKKVTNVFLLLKIVDVLKWMGIILSFGGMLYAAYLRFKTKNLVQITSMPKEKKNVISMSLGGSSTRSDDRGYLNQGMNLNQPDKF